MVCSCPNGCKFFRPKSNCTKVVERKYSSGPYGYVEKTTTTYSEVDGAY
nr:MAG TPA: Complement C5-like protein [Bacteriophage sp.]